MCRICYCCTAKSSDSDMTPEWLLLPIIICEAVLVHGKELDQKIHSYVCKSSKLAINPFVPECPPFLMMMCCTIDNNTILNSRQCHE
jgi:hypothetical protein